MRKFGPRAEKISTPTSSLNPPTYKNSRPPTSILTIRPLYEGEGKGDGHQHGRKPRIPETVPIA